MGVTLTTVGEYIGSYFAAGTTAETAATAAEATAAAASTSAAPAAVAAAGAASGGAAVSAGTAAATSASIATTVSEAAAVAQGASALYSLAAGPGRINVPPTPGVAGRDESVQAAEQAAIRREQARAGLQSTTGTPGGQAGAVLNPATMSNRSVLGG